MSSEHLVLAGGGHTHALILRGWAMNPKLRPQGLITLISLQSGTIYSAMLPGFLSGNYSYDEIIINVRSLAEKAGVAFVLGEINYIDTNRKEINISGRPSMPYSKLSIDVGSKTLIDKEFLERKNIVDFMPIKPFKKSIDWIIRHDDLQYFTAEESFNIIGSGLAAVEIAFALRKRWPNRNLRLHCKTYKIKSKVLNTLLSSDIKIISESNTIVGPVLLCTGSEAPEWLEKSGLLVNSSRRVLSSNSLQVIDYPDLFVAGDSGIIINQFRPASGVWAVRAAKILSTNLKRSNQSLKLKKWNPQKIALQIVVCSLKNSTSNYAFIFFGKLVLGPTNLFFRWKEFLDKSFMRTLNPKSIMNDANSMSMGKYGCRGCAAKIGESILQEALSNSGLDHLGIYPEDSALVTSSSLNGDSIFQTVDGFPALVSDPWLNGRLASFHACSDIWSTGALVKSVQAIITLPKVEKHIQKFLLTQTILGIKSALLPQNAQLIGGHTLEARTDPETPSTLGVQINLCVNGFLKNGTKLWSKGGLRNGDAILISGPLGTGVLFAASMEGYSNTDDIDAVIQKLGIDQYNIFKSLYEINNLERSFVNSCTDITGFGLLGHLGEMLRTSNYQRSKLGLSSLRIILDSPIPVFPGVFSLFSKGFESSLAGENRKALSLLKKSDNNNAPIELHLDEFNLEKKDYRSLFELIVDPQTCGPLVISCEDKFADILISHGPWKKIGNVRNF